MALEVTGISGRLLIKHAKPLVSAVISTGRRNTKLEVFLQEFQKLKSFASVASSGRRPV
jgi:hypothetical protein